LQTTRLQRRAAAVAVGLLVSSLAFGQQSEGSIYGHGKPGEKVTITSADNGSTRQLSVDANGVFNAAKLPPGAYHVTMGGQSRDVNVAIGSGTAVDFAEMARVVVSGTRTAIDVNSVESNSVFTADQIKALPVARDVNAVAILAPSVVKGDPNLGGGGLPAFSGASVAENGYYINGFDVTNIRNFLSYANLPFDAIGAEQVKSGGYGAEFGRSLGGVISIVTKRGTNTWKGGGAVYWDPDQLKSSGKNVANLDPEYKGEYTVFSQPNKSRNLSANVYAGGPLIKDKLFFFGLVEGRADTGDSFGQNSSVHTLSNHPNGMVKIDFTPNDTHRFEFTGITNETKTAVTDYLNPAGATYATSHVGSTQNSTVTSGGHTLIAKYTGYLADNFTLSVLGGKVKDKLAKTTGDRVSALSCPTVYDVDVTLLGCWKEPFGTTARDPKAPDDEDDRKAFRVDAEYALGSHTLRGGIDSQKFSSKQAGSTYSGDVYWRYLQANSKGTVNGVVGATAPGGIYVRRRLSRSTSGAFDVQNDAYYLEDSWKVTKNVLLYGGLRSESFNNKNADGVSFVKSDNLFAPRLGFSWDANGDASMKVYGNAGRYYIPVASNTNIRATRGELFEQRFYNFTSKDPVTGAPQGLGPEIGQAQINGDGTLPNPATIADMNLKPMSQDEYILGFQHALTQGWSMGVKGIYRKVQNGMDDYCSHLGFEKWAADNGHKNFDSSTMAQCMLVNPGNDVTLMTDIDNNGKLQPITFPASYIGLEKYTRTYKALEFTLERPFNGKWGLTASYVLSQSRGTAEGYVNSIINQEDAGVSQDFDFPSLTKGTDGYLSNDRRHVFKAFGNYMLSDELRLGFNAVVASGRPISCIGFVPTSAPDYSDAAGYTTASSFYCVNDQGVSELHNRGTFGRTPWTESLDLSLAWIPKWDSHKVTFQLDIFNVFNTQHTTEVNETRDFSRSTTSDTEGRASLNWKQPTSFQEPRSVRVTARYEF
jgi:hypothetical protein